jgi:thymidylate synthase
MIAHVTGRDAGEFIHMIGDCHVYLNHIDALQEQLKREPRPFPKLRIKRQVQDIEDFKFEDFEIVGYDPHPAVKMEMAV